MEIGNLTYTQMVCIVPVKAISHENPMTRRINIVLPEATIRVLDRVAPKGNRSRLISDAVIHYVTGRAKSNLAEGLKQGALSNAQRDLEIAQEWFSVDEGAWQRTKPAAKRKK
jgi:CopG family transcriptional regulator/antitoxin EndoAI